MPDDKALARRIFFTSGFTGFAGFVFTGDVIECTQVTATIGDIGVTALDKWRRVPCEQVVDWTEAEVEAYQQKQSKHHQQSCSSPLLPLDRNFIVGEATVRSLCALFARPTRCKESNRSKKA